MPTVVKSQDQVHGYPHTASIWSDTEKITSL